MYNWCKIFSAITTIYIESGIYENWAESELAEIQSQINKGGIAIARNLTKKQNKIKFFYSLPDEIKCDSTKCPICNKLSTLTKCEIYKYSCEKCFVVWSNYNP